MDPSIFILIAVLAVAVGVYFLNRNSNSGDRNGSNGQPYDPFPEKPVQPRKAPAQKSSSSKKKTAKKKTTKKKTTKKSTGKKSTR